MDIGAVAASPDQTITMFTLFPHSGWLVQKTYKATLYILAPGEGIDARITEVFLCHL